MYSRDELCPRSVTFVVLQQFPARFLVQRALGIRIDQEALDGDEDMLDPICRLPVLLERVHTDLTGGRDVRVEDLGEHPTYTKRDQVNDGCYPTVTGSLHLGGAFGNSSVKLKETLK
jgi:hypothetical protein